MRENQNGHSFARSLWPIAYARGPAGSKPHFGPSHAEMATGDDGIPSRPKRTIAHMDYLDTFELWLEHQQCPRPIPADLEPMLRQQYEAAVERFIEHDPSGWMRQPLKSDEHRYAVVIDDAQKQWVTLCVVRSPKPEYFILIPRDSEWDPHASYHQSGRYHQKSAGLAISRQQRQPLPSFKGAEHLSSFMGHGTHMAIYRPSNYTAALVVPAGVLRGLEGEVLIDLVEPGPLSHALTSYGLPSAVADRSRRYRTSHVFSPRRAGRQAL